LGSAESVFARARAVFDEIGDEMGATDSLRLQGVVRQVDGRPLEAYEHLLAAERLARDASDPCVLARVRLDLGNACFHLGRHPEAIQHYREALRLEEDAQHAGHAAGALNLLGRLHYKLGYLDEADGFYARALERCSLAADPLTKAAVLRNFAKTARRRGQLQAALELGREALSVYERFDRASALADCLKGVGLLHAEAGDYQEAVACLRRSAAGFGSLGDNFELGRCLLEFGGLLERIGSRKDAQRLYCDALDLEEIRRLPSILAPAGVHGVDGLLALGESSTARDKFEAEVERWRRGGEATASAAAFLRRGDVWQRQGAPSRALQSYAAGFELYTEQGDRFGAIQTLRGLGRALCAAGSADKALVAQEEALRRAESVGETLEAAALRLELAETLRRLDRLSDAFACAEAAAAFAEKSSALELGWRAEAELARVAALDGDGEREEKHLRRTIETIEKAEANLDEEGLHVRLADAMQEHHDALVAHLARAGRWRDALFASERSRARALRQLWQRRWSPEPTEPPACSEPSSEELHRALRDRTLIVYHALPASLIVWALEEGGKVTVREVLVARSALAERVEELRRLLATERHEFAGKDSGCSRLADALNGLYGLLLEPLAEVLNRHEGQELSIVPHGPLIEVPFCALRDGEGRFLVERFSLTHALCLSQVLRARAVDAPGRVLLLGDPAPDDSSWGRLPAAAEEVREVAALLAKSGASLDVLCASSASEAAFRRLAPRSAWLHIAAHAVQECERSDAPALLLARTGAESFEDGRLGADEVAQLKLAGAVVVLSGCETARGEITSDGALGLMRSFFSAGASGVAASLWRMEDGAARSLMVRFYRALADGESVAGALRQAQLELLRTPREPPCASAAGPDCRRMPDDGRNGARQVPQRSLSHPASWGGVVVYGEGGDLRFRR
jgi:CHAT domain-containing protein